MKKQGRQGKQTWLILINYKNISETSICLLAWFFAAWSTVLVKWWTIVRFFIHRPTYPPKIVQLGKQRQQFENKQESLFMRNLHSPNKSWTPFSSDSVSKASLSTVNICIFFTRSFSEEDLESNMFATGAHIEVPGLVKHACCGLLREPRASSSHFSTNSDRHYGKQRDKKKARLRAHANKIIP